jgi:hypothetical protein
MKIKRICGREFRHFEEGENGVRHESGIYEFQGHQIAAEWIDVGFDDRWGNYRETTIRRWVILGKRPYYQYNYKSITEAADNINR